MNEFTKEIIEQAKSEFEQEKRRALIDKYKQKLRTKKTLLDRIMPFKILIVRKEKFL